jgi:hypothetical protein
MSSKFRFGGITLDALDIGSRANGVLGIRDSGKSVTAKALAEHIHDHGIPFVGFDPSGVWRFLRVPGKGKGRPIVVAGGVEADLPLSPASAPQIVEAAMQQGLSLVLDFHGVDLSKAQWRAIVRDCVQLMLRKNRLHGLRHVFLEEAAEFVPQRVIDGLVYAEVEKLARIGGNQGLGITLINQRAEEVNKAVLELCDNLFLHRTKGKNSLQSLNKWLELGAVKDARVVIDSLSTLPTGECWAWLREASQPVHLHVPPTSSFHPDRRAMRGDVKLAHRPVDVKDFVAKLLGELPKIEEQAKANDPAELKRRIIALEAEIKGQHVSPAPEVLNAAREEGYRQGMDAYRPGLKRLSEAADKIEAALGDLRKAVDQKLLTALEHAKLIEPAHRNTNPQYHRTGGKGERPVHYIANVTWPSGRVERLESHPTKPAHRIEEPSHLTKPRQRILDTLGFLETIGEPTPSKVQLALWCGASPKSSAYANNLGALRSEGLIDYPGGQVALSDEGHKLAHPLRMSQPEMQRSLLDRLTVPQANIMSYLLAVYPTPMARDALAEQVAASANSSAYANNLGTLRSMGVLDYPSRGEVVATKICFMGRS